jgi:hypothetical protein
VETGCPYCKVRKLRYDLEFQAEKGQIIKNVCAHCLTVCGEPPSMDFLCARCGQLTLCIEASSDSEAKMFQRIFSPDPEFSGFYEQLLSGGLKEGKRFCMPCVYKIWQEFLKCPASLQEELEKPKPEYALK